MPLIVYASQDVIKADGEARKEPIDVDLSSISSSDIAERVETIRTHQRIHTKIYIGFLDPLFMISPYHETILRRGIGDCTVIVTTSDPTALSLFWKNGTTHLHIVL